MAGVDTFEGLSATKGLKIAHLNVRSIMKKIDQLRILLHDSRIDVLTFSETWLKPHLHSDLLNLEGYKLYRADRSTGGKTKKRGGGLLTYIKNSHSSSCEQLSNLDTVNVDIEAQWILIHRPHCKNVIICNLYRPPNGNLIKVISYLEKCLESINMDKTDLFLLGDLNVDFQNKSSPNHKKINFFIQSNGLTQLVNTTTRNTNKSQTLLDVILSNSKVISHAGTLNHHISDHQPIYVVHKKGRDGRESVKFRGRSYRDFDKEEFGNRLRNVADWGDLCKMSDPNCAWDFMLRHITTILDELCPIKTFHIKNYRPDWMTDELIEQIKDRDYFYRKAKATGDEDAWNIAKYLRNVTNSHIRSSKREFILNELKKNEDDAKKFWKIIKKVIPSKHTSSQDILLKDNEGTKLDKCQVADYINDFFIDVGKPDLSNSLHEGQHATDQSNLHAGEPVQPMSFGMVTEVQTFKVIRDINIAKSSGIDNLSSFILKEAFTILATEVTQMFNLSLRTSIFPSLWKKALVIPIPKTGNLSLVQNYRPISLLPLPGKILEKLAHKQISDYLDEKSLLTDKQHGFRKSHSTTHSVAQLVNFVNYNMDMRRPTLAVYIDFRKAFDCVQHDILIEKLKRLNLHASVIGWIQSYLYSREQRVFANDVYSESRTIMQGVPQGSVLGPLFYITYANDLSELFKSCQFALYADDTVLYTADDVFEDSVFKLQQDMDRLSTWCKLNGIKVNTNKTKVMVFGSKTAVSKLPTFEILYNNEPLPKVLSYNYLGVTLDSKLNYNLHIKKLIATVSAKLKQFQRMRNFLNTKAALLVYKSMMLPIIEYGDIFLSAASVENRKKLQTLQNKGLRCALRKSIDTATTGELHAEAGLLKLKYRREQHLLNFLYDWSLDKKELVRRSTDSVQTRTSQKRLFKLKKPHTEKYKKSLAYKGKAKWNELHTDFHQAATKGSYKLLVRNWIIQKSITNSNYLLAD